MSQPFQSSTNALFGRLPAEYSPMLLVSANEPFQKKDWVFEPKLDGMRIIAIVKQPQVWLFSRSGRNVTTIFPEVCNSLGRFPGSFILDGELIASDADGRPNFEALQNRNEFDGYLWLEPK